MRFEPLTLPGAYLIELEPIGDSRGIFARAFCAREFAAHGLETTFVQANMSMTSHAGTLRGLHYQLPPHAEAKLLRSIKGAVHHVVVDMRKESPTFRRWLGAELSEDNARMLYVPKGCAHGFQALTDGATTFYMVSAFYAPEAEAGVRNDDPALSIAWPRAVTQLSDKDARWPLLPR